MTDKFDAFTNALAQSSTRRGAFKQFGFGLAAIVLSALGLPQGVQAGAKHDRGYCLVNADGTLTGDCLTLDCRLDQLNPGCPCGAPAQNVIYDSKLCIGPYDATSCTYRRRR